MAADVLSNISGALAQTMAPQLIRTWNRRAVGLQNVRILLGGGQGNGQNVAWDVEMTGATAAAFAEGSDVTSGEYNQDTIVKAKLDWGMYRAPFQLSNLEINVAAANIGNASALEDIVGERFIGAITKIVDLMQTDFYSGTGTDGSGNPNIVGLDSALAATGLYGGLNKSTYATWAGNVLANGGTARALTMGLLASSEQQTFVASGMEPDVLITTAGVHTKYEGLFEATRRTVDSGQGPIQSYQGSSGRLFWRGKPVIRDKSATTGQIYMVSQDGIELRVLPWAAVPDGVMVVQKAAVSSNGDQMEQIGIPFNCYPLARTGSAIKFVVEVYAQLKVLRTNAHSLIKDISES